MLRLVGRWAITLTLAASPLWVWLGVYWLGMAYGIAGASRGIDMNAPHATAWLACLIYCGGLFVGLVLPDVKGLIGDGKRGCSDRTKVYTWTRGKYE
jgi:hypothetical protein